MIKTVPIDISLNLIIGLVLAGSAGDYLRTSEVKVFNKAFAYTFMYGFLVFLPIGALLFIWWPDWSLMYFIDAERLPRNISLVIILGSYQLALVSGFFIGHHLTVNKRMETLALLVVLNMIFLLYFCGLAADRIFNVGTHHAFYYENASIEPFFSSSLCYAFIPIILYFSIPLLYTVRRVKYLHSTINESSSGEDTIS